MVTLHIFFLFSFLLSRSRVIAKWAQISFKTAGNSTVIFVLFRKVELKVVLSLIYFFLVCCLQNTLNKHGLLQLETYSWPVFCTVLPYEAY